MASLLVYIDPRRLQTLVTADARNSGRSWIVDRAQLPEPGLDRLDELGTLFVMTVDADRAIVVAAVDDPEITDGAFTGGDALLRDHDITSVLPRLGCPDVAAIPEWARVPRVLPPGDDELLRYTLGLTSDLVRPPAPPEPIVTNDPMLDTLRAAVFAEPDADEPRMIYADYLQSLGDPRGELIALQIARARARGPIGDRERILVERYGKDCAQPMTPHLAWFELSRGFVRRCVAGHDAELPIGLCADPAWSTVDTLGTDSAELLTSPYVRARRLATTGSALPLVAAAGRPAPFEVIVGSAGRSLDRHATPPQTGIWITREAGWEPVMNVGALTNLRVLAINHRSLGIARIALLLRSALGKQLEQLDVWCDLTYDVPTTWRGPFDQASLPLLTIRFALAGGRPVAKTVDGLLALQRTKREPLLTLQLPVPLRGDRVTQLMRIVAPLGRGLHRIEVNDLAVPDQVEQRHHEVLARLRTMFSRVVARPGDDMTP